MASDRRGARRGPSRRARPWRSRVRWITQHGRSAPFILGEAEGRHRAGEKDNPCSHWTPRGRPRDVRTMPAPKASARPRARRAQSGGQRPHLPPGVRSPARSPSGSPGGSSAAASSSRPRHPPTAEARPAGRCIASTTPGHPRCARLRTKDQGGSTDPAPPAPRSSPVARPEARASSPGRRAAASPQKSRRRGRRCGRQRSPAAGPRALDRLGTPGADPRHPPGSRRARQASRPCRAAAGTQVDSRRTTRSRPAFRCRAECSSAPRQESAICRRARARAALGEHHQAPSRPSSRRRDGHAVVHHGAAPAEAPPPAAQRAGLRGVRVETSHGSARRRRTIATRPCVGDRPRPARPAWGFTAAGRCLRAASKKKAGLPARPAGDGDAVVAARGAQRLQDADSRMSRALQAGAQSAHGERTRAGHARRLRRTGGRRGGERGRGGHRAPAGRDRELSASASRTPLGLDARRRCGASTASSAGRQGGRAAGPIGGAARRETRGLVSPSTTRWAGRRRRHVAEGRVVADEESHEPGRPQARTGSAEREGVGGRRRCGAQVASAGPPSRRRRRRSVRSARRSDPRTVWAQRWRGSDRPVEGDRGDAAPRPARRLMGLAFLSAVT